MASLVLPLRDVDRTMTHLVGGKAANLGELARIDGVRVPEGFVVTAEALAAMGDAPPTAPLPPALTDAIAQHLAGLGDTPVAVRSSATAEDLPTASFAGQYETFLGITGLPDVLTHIRRCLASLHADRAVAYRRQAGIDHVRMAVIVQRMVPATVAGVLFTADPFTSNRTVTTIEAVRGLGEALVSGHAGADRFQLRRGEVLTRSGTLLTDAQLLDLERLGRRIEAHFGAPQDIEWCLADGEIHVVQGRPITTLYPLPRGAEPGNRVYVSVGHQQMMTDPLRPLGLSVFQLTAGRPMYEAGGRLFVDVTRELSTPAGRAAILGGLGRTEPLIRDALATVIERGFVPDSEDASPPRPPHTGPPPAPPDDDRALVASLIAENEAAVAAAEANLRGKTGRKLLDALLTDIQALKLGLLTPRSFAAIVGSMNAATWLNDQLCAWLGEKNAADTLAQSAPGNVTSEMGLALLDVADVIREHPAVVAYLRDARDDSFLDGLLPLPGGPEAHAALAAFLHRYGMRCAGEIDLTRPRWGERPTTLVPLLLAHVRTFASGEGRRRFLAGERQAAAKEAEILTRLAALPDGEQKVAETRRTIRRLRDLAGYREYPKYGIVRRFFLYRQALLSEARRLTAAGVLADPEDLTWLTLPEVREALATGHVDPALLAERRAEHARFVRLTPPRVLTSEGETVTGDYRRTDLPAGALVGLAVSAGVVEGRARVITDLAAADLADGDILVTPFTDPSWTPAFVAVKGLVTEVGGLTTHGAVIAREYGLPAVIGVVDATRRIRDGQRIRVHGTEGYVELLD